VTAVDFDDFYERTAHRLVQQLFLLTGDWAEAEDVVSEAYQRAWLRWNSVQCADSPEAWVRTVARRLAVSRWRRARNATVAWRRLGAAAERPPLDGVHVDLVNALRNLPAKQRTAVVLHHLADMSVEQVAAETEASVSAVKQQLVRGRAALAELLGDVAVSGDGVPLRGEVR
jgi:RNA polymerase sigma-70 factor (ECF subfamily)